MPTSAGTAKQHVRETSSGGWCEFSDWNARCFANFNNRLYFGDSSGVVWRADVGTQDGTTRISSWAIPAFNGLGNKAQRKQITAASVVSSAMRPASYAYDGMADFNTSVRSTLIDDPGSAAAVWDVADWDISSWGSADAPVKAGWKNVSAIGYAVSLSLRINQRSQQIAWYSTTLQFRNAGVL